MLVDSLAKKLLRLSVDKSLPASILSKIDREKLQPLFDSGVLDEERSGGGRRIVLRHSDGLSAFIQRNYPSGLERTLNEEFPPKSIAVAYARDAKKAGRADAEVLCLRAFGNAVLIKDGYRLPLAEWCRIAGVAAIQIDDRLSLEISGKIAVVENMEVFLHFEKLKVCADIVFYSEGRLSRRVIDWLSSQTECRIMHIGDYDPVGLDEYLRLKSACPGRVELYLPDNLEQLFIFGKKRLLSDSTAVFTRLRKSKDSTVQYVVDLMNRHGVGLEQEILLSRSE